MKKRKTPLNLSVIITKIDGHIGLFVQNERTEKDKKLIMQLMDIQDVMKPFVWLDVNSTPDIDYRETVPVMADMIEWINEFEIVDELHNWHYQEHNSAERLDDLIDLSSHFLSFIEKELI